MKFSKEHCVTFNRFLPVLVIVSICCVVLLIEGRRQFLPETGNEKSIDGQERTNVSGVDREFSKKNTFKDLLTMSSYGGSDSSRSARMKREASNREENSAAAAAGQFSFSDCRDCQIQMPNVSSNTRMPLHERISQRVASIKAEILRKLRMHSQPNVTGSTADELASMHRFYNQLDHEVESNFSRRISVSDQASNENELSTPLTLISISRFAASQIHNLPNACHFQFNSDKYDANQILSAHLGIHLRPSQMPLNSSQAVLHLNKVGRRANSSSSRDGSYKTEYYRRRRITTSNGRNIVGRWYFFEVKHLVQTWIRQPNSNLGVTVTATDLQGHPLTNLVVVQSTSPQEETLRPFIEVKLNPQHPPRRSKRTTTELVCHEDRPESRCCRYPLSIDFDSFRWDWVIAPKRYEAYYCAGDCPFLYHQTSSRVHLMTQVSASMPCCAPTQTSPLSMIHLDDKSKAIVFSSIPDMIVNKCGCS